MYLSKESVRMILDACKVHHLEDGMRVVSLNELNTLINGCKEYKITIDQAQEVIDNMRFKKEMDLDCSGLLVEMLHNEHWSLIDQFITKKPDNWKINAIKIYRNIMGKGLADAKYAIEERERQINNNKAISK